MTLNCIWWWGSSAEALGITEYFFIAITPRCTLTRMVALVRVPTMDQIKLFNHLLYLKPFNCVQIKLLVFNINTWNYWDLVRVKMVSFKLFVYKSYIYLIYICINRIWHKIINKSWYSINPTNQPANQPTKSFNECSRLNFIFIALTDIRRKNIVHPQKQK